VRKRDPHGSGSAVLRERAIERLVDVLEEREVHVWGCREVVQREARTDGRVIAAHEAGHGVFVYALCVMAWRDHGRDAYQQVNRTARKAVLGEHAVERDQTQAHVGRAGLQMAKQGREQDHGDGVCAGHAERTRRLGRIELRRTLEDVQRLADPASELRLEGERPRGGFEPVRAPHHEWVIEQRPRALQRIADGGLGHVKVRGCASGTAHFEDDAQHVEQVEVDRADIFIEHNKYHTISFSFACGWYHAHAMNQRAPTIDTMAHATLPVADLEVAERFYVGILGATLVRKVDRECFLSTRPERAAEVDAANSPLHLAVRFQDTPEIHLFLQRGRPKTRPAPHPHIAFTVDADELDAFVGRLAAAGVPLDGPRRLGPPGHASVYFADPFGNTLELVATGYSGAVAHGAPDVAELGW
jgi:catechol 2,3-dioxygenase-like lactoylglutathione lyase family enzyme